MDSGHTVGSVRAADEPFGTLLRRSRERAGLTQEQLAERAGISANAVSALERGTRRRPYAHTRDALATALGLTATERAAWNEQAPVGIHPRLPVPPSTILGRDSDIAAVSRLLGTARIVTLTGPGGVGKTRLALAVAAQAAFPDGALFVPLAGLHDPTDVLPAVAHGLGLRELGPRAVADVLAAHLRHRRLLLVLDNVEHLLDAAPDIGELVAATAGVAVLATSRAPLRLRGEHVHSVPALPPAVAVEMFAERAAQAGGRLEAGAPVAEICARLDHLPLAIELAAPQSRVLTGRELLDRLDAVVLGSTAGPRDAPARQQTLRHTVGWSYELLEPAAQAVLRQVAVFDGGWTLAAVTPQCGVPDAVALDLHRTLVDNSLVTRQPGARFAMLETVRAFALDRLTAAGEADAARDRHAALFGGVAAGAQARLWSEEQADALDALEADHDNLRSALRRLLERGRIDELAAACFGSWLFWVVRGHLRDPHALALAALAAGADLDPTTAARLHVVVGCTALPRGDHDGAAEHFAQAARLAVDDVTRHWALIWGANAEVYRARPDAAAQLLAAAGAARGHAASCAVIGHAHVAIATGDMPAADALLTECLPAIEARGAAWPIGVALGIHGRVVAVLGDPERAGALLTRSVEIFGEIGDTWGMAHQLTHIADVAAQRGDHDKAALLYGAVDALTEEVGARVFQVWQDLSDRCQAAALAALGVQRYTALRRQGRALAPAEVVELAVGR